MSDHGSREHIAAILDAEEAKYVPSTWAVQPARVIANIRAALLGTDDANDDRRPRLGR